MFDIYWDLQKIIEYYKTPVKLYLVEGHLIRIYMHDAEMSASCDSVEAELESSIYEHFAQHPPKTFIMLFGDKRLLNFNKNGCLL